MTKEMKGRIIHIDDERWERAKTVAGDCGMSVSMYIRSLLDLKMPRQIPPKEWRDLYRVLAGIGNNINQMAKLSHIEGSADYELFKSDLKEIKAIRTELQRIGTEPEDVRKS